MNAYANHVLSHLLAQSWQIAVLAAIVGLISLSLRGRSAHLRYLLWLIVLAKCLVPPFVTVPLAVLPERSLSPSVARVGVPEEHSAPETPVSVVGVTQPQELNPAVPSTRELITLVWTVGALVFLLWVGGRAIRYTSWLRAQRNPLPPGLQESIHELCVGFKFKKLPRIWLLEDISQPFVWGLLRGSAYLPADFVGLSGSDQQRSVLAHELSHIARFDAGVNLLQVMVQAMYWFHPFVWWSNRKIRQEREKCCDEMAIVHLNTLPEHYTGAIVDALVAERRSAHPIPSLAIVGSVRDIEERIKTMLKPGKKFYNRPSLVAATVALLMALVTIPTALVLTARGQVQPTTQSADKPAQSLNAVTADAEKPEQPRYAARTFNSKVAFKVFILGGLTAPIRPVGSTPSAAPLEIPACYVWLVQPSAPVADWDLLIREMSEKKIPGLVLTQATDSDLSYSAGLTGLQFLGLDRSTQVTDAGLAHLAGLTRLQWLDLSGTKLTDAGLEHLKGLSELQKLQLKSAQVTDAGLSHLAGLTRLQWLDLSNTKITDAGLEHLKGLTKLQTLYVSETQITDAGLAHLKGLTTLQEMNLASTKITDAGLAHLKGLTKLQTLYVSETQITDTGLVHLKGLTGLQSLYLAGTKITDGGLVHLKGLTRLQWLDLSGTQITDAGLVHLKGLTGLQSLFLADTQITDAGLAHLKGLTGLQKLYVANTQITDTGLVHLKGLTGLRMLNVAYTQITDVGLGHLKGLTGLQLLFLSDKITDAGVEHLKGLTGLQYLWLGGKITDAGIEHLKGLTGLQFLGLSGTQVTDAGVQRLKQSLPNLTIERGEGQPTAQSVDKPAPSPNKPAAASEKPEQPPFAARIFNSTIPLEVLVHERGQSELSPRSIGRTPSAAPLEIPACLIWWVRPTTPVKDWESLLREIGQSEVPGLILDSAKDSDAKHLADSTALKGLYLNGNEMTDAGLVYLKGLTKLQFLIVRGPKITDAGLAHLKGLTRLQSLRLGGSKVTDVGLAYLKGLTELRSLGLYVTQITDAGLVHLKGLTRLQFLNLSYTQVTDAGLVHLKGLTGLRTLTLDGTKITDAGLVHLKGLTGLAKLVLSGDKITDAGLAHLKGLAGLGYLDLTGTQITDAGLEHLKGLTGLELLRLSETQVTDAGVQQLKQNLPKLTIDRTIERDLTVPLP